MRVLVVDDSAGDVRLLQEAFASQCVTCQVEVATQVSAARHLLRQGGYDVVIVDLNLPGDRGLALLDEPAAREARCVVFSTSDSEEDQRDARASGAADFVVKPRDWTGYRDVVQRLLGAAIPSGARAAT